MPATPPEESCYAAWYVTPPPHAAPNETAQLSAQLDAAREAVREALRSDARGFTIVGDYSATLRTLLTRVVARAMRSWDETLCAVSVLETGSLARDELCPYADIDLVVLCARPLDGEESFAHWMRDLLHPLWDCGLKITSVAQTPDAWFDGCASDLSLCTSLVDARVVGGDDSMLDTLRARMMHAFAGERRLGLLMRLREEMERRFVRYGGTVYKLEPDLKLGAGGLRDLASLRWAFALTYNTGSLPTLVSRSILRKRSSQVLEASANVLLELRCALHLAAGRAQDRLVFRYQDGLPAILGDADEDASDEVTVAAIESFMQRFHEAANLSLRFGRREFRRCLPPRLGPRLDRRIDERFRAVDHRLVHDGWASFAESPALGLQAIAMARDHGLSIGARAVDSIVDGAGDPRSSRMAEDPEAHRWFLNVLTDPKDGGSPTPLERCHEYGLLERVIPEFGPCRGRMQHESFHAYTVDQHSLYVVEFLKALVRGEYRKDYSLGTAVHLGIDDPRPLYLAALLHDVGKPHGDQCDVGASLALQVATRLGFSADDAQRTARLVALHLEMPTLSQRRDLSDPMLIRGFAQQVGERRFLSELYLLSIADMSAVAPDYLSSWKATLLDELYLLTAAELSGEVHRRSLGQRARGDEPEGLPERYYALYDVTLRRAHRAMLERVHEEGTRVVMDVRAGAGGLLRVTVAARDQPGLLAHIAAEFDEVGLEVLAADVFPVPGEAPAALDVFRVSVRAGHELRADQEWIHRVEERLDGRLSQHQEFRRPPSLQRVRRGGRRRAGDCVVKFDEDPGRARTIVEVETDDQPGVLRRIAQAFAMCDAEIELARLMTEGPRVLDIFYVSRLDERGRASLERQVQEYLRRRDS